jgi:hypothetical protein
MKSKDQQLLEEAYEKVNELCCKLLESKQVGVLYHNTYLNGLVEILKNNQLVAFSNPEHNEINFRNKDVYSDSDYDEDSDEQYSDPTEYPPAVSFTRSKSYEMDPTYVKLVIDGDKLSNNYKVVPYSHFGGRKFDEMEEKVYSNINNLDKYIIRVIFPSLLQNKPHTDSTLKEVVSLLKEKNIPYEFKG